MAKDAPRTDFDDKRIKVDDKKDYAAGVAAVAKSLQMANEQMGVVRTARTLGRLNQKHGFDCPGCAWPDPEHRSPAEFCENGVKAVAEEATLRRVGPEFFRRHPVADLEWRSGYWLGQQGRITEPVWKAAGSDHYEPVSWDRAFEIIASHLKALPSPDQAVFYTSGRTSNEAAFLYQLMVRRFGTNNLPDCSNMCHESSGTALGYSIGIGKGSVLLEDVHAADLIIVVGQNPGTNHPRMLTALEKAKENGAHIVSVNPLIEPGLQEFKNPQSPVGAVKGTKLADDFLQVRLAGDQALFAALGKLTLEADDESARQRGGRGDVVDWDFVDRHCSEFEEYAAAVRALPWDEITTATGLTRDEIDQLARRYRSSDRVIVCWAMGITQHKNAVATIREIANLMFLRGNIGKRGAGLFPVRGHSNVQGDRTMGIWEKMPESFIDGIRDEFGFEPNREHGLDTVNAIRAMRDGDVKVFLGMGGNFASATPDSAVTEKALRGCDLTVQVSTKLNRSHVVTGKQALILPCLGRTERDEQATGEQFVTVEDSMGMVHRSRGRLAPASPYLKSEVAIVAELAVALFGRGDRVDWLGLRDDYDMIRRHIERVVPGFDDFNRRVRRKDGFALPHPPRDSRTFQTETGKARFSANELDTLRVPEGHLLLTTIRSHDQFNTTIYGLDDRYRGVKRGRRVVFVHADDLAGLGLAEGESVDLVSVWQGGETRRAESFRVVPYPTARGCAAAYYPETNVLVPLDSVALGSNQPASKSVVVRLERRTAAG